MLRNGLLPAPPSAELLNLVLNSHLVYDFDPPQAVTDLWWGGPVDGIGFWKALADNAYVAALCQAGTPVSGFGTCTGNEWISPQADPAFVKPTLGDIEALIDNGDSGGPGLIDGKVAGVHSFGKTLFTSDCNHYINEPDLLCDPEDNSSFGDISGDTNVAAYYDWIRGAAGIPEPPTIMLFLASAFGLGLARRRRTA